jgi:hypothetical protein
MTPLRQGTFRADAHRLGRGLDQGGDGLAAGEKVELWRGVGEAGEAEFARRRSALPVEFLTNVVSPFSGDVLVFSLITAV